MTMQAIRHHLRQQPFRPFRLVMSTGLSYEVTRREMAFLTRKEIVVGIDETDEGVPDGFKICSLPQVAAIVPLD